jgi:sugar/nucleoside kinase (ribokinase family)
MNYLGVFGHVVIDNIVRVPELPRLNASIGIDSRQRFFGGTGANLARMASSLGVTTSLASFVGEDFPRDYFDALKSDGIDLEDLRVIEGYSTPTCYVFTDGKNQLNFIDQGPMKVAPKFDVLKHTVKSSEIIHIGTGRPEYYKKVVDFADGLKREISFDPGQEIHYVYDSKSLRSLLNSAKYFFVNSAELKTALKLLKLKRTKDILDRVEVLIQTKGDKGSKIHTQDETFTIPAIKPKRFVDATGAGDAFRAGFYAALSRNYDLERCGYAGAIASSLVIGTLGAQTKLPKWNNIKTRIKRYSQ